MADLIGRRIGMTLLAALLIFMMAIGAGITVGRRQGAVAGIAMGFGVLVACVIVFVGLLAFSLPM
jgi:hypothetical protein